VPRTYFSGQEPPGPDKAASVERILRTLAFWDPKLAYCQGLNFLAAFALESSRWKHVSEDLGGQACSQSNIIVVASSGTIETDAFWLVACLMRDYGARNLFLDKTPLLKLYGFCLRRLVEKRMPELHVFLSGLEQVLGYKWFGTLFTTVLPPVVTARAWDLMLREGLHTLLFVAVGLCSMLEPSLLAAEAEGLEAYEVIGDLQRRLPRDIEALLPKGWAQQNGVTAGEAAGIRLLEATERVWGGGVDDLEELLLEWRSIHPSDAADLDPEFSFQRGKRWRNL